MSKLQKKEAEPVGDLVKAALKSLGISAQHNSFRIGKAWDEASGAAKHTARRFYRDGVLYVTLSSSVVRSQLSFGSDRILESINSILQADELFIQDEKTTGGPVKKLVLK